MEKFKKLYRLPNYKIRTNTNMNSFLFCGKNWDYYFTEKNSDTDLEEFQDVVISQEFHPEKFIDLDNDNTWKYLQYA
jgi:hypothetical protein